MKKPAIKLTVGYTCPHCAFPQQYDVTDWLAAIVQLHTVPCQNCQRPVDASNTVYVPMQPEPAFSPL